MYKNLMAEYARKGVKPHLAVMEALKCSEKTARNKLKEITPITIPEAIKIRNFTFSNDGFSIEYLFSSGVEKR